MTTETLLDIARCGVLAPSADNHHVFRIELGDGTIRLWPTRDFDACTDRLRRVLGLMSLGAVVENMRLRAGELGLAAAVTWAVNGEVGPIAELAFSPAAAPADELAAAIPARHTNRRMYRGPAPDAAEGARLDASVAAVDGVRLVWLQGESRRRALRLIWLAESERFLRPQLHQELFESIRFDLGWGEGAERAIPPGALEVEAPMRPMFKALRHWSLMRPLTWLGVHRLLGLRAGWLPCWQAPALGLLTTTLPLAPGAVAVGAALERLWLQATLLGMALQPMAAAAVLPLQTVGDGGASEGLRATLSACWQGIVVGQTPLMALRLGRAAPPSLVSGRPPLEQFFVNASGLADRPH